MGKEAIRLHKVLHIKINGGQNRKYAPITLGALWFFVGSKTMSSRTTVGQQV